MIAVENFNVDGLNFVSLFSQNVNSNIPIFDTLIFAEGMQLISKLREKVLLMDQSVPDIYASVSKILSSEDSAKVALTWASCSYGAFLVNDERYILYLGLCHKNLQQCFDGSTALVARALFSFEVLVNVFAESLPIIRCGEMSSLFSALVSRRGVYFALGEAIIHFFNIHDSTCSILMNLIRSTSQLNVGFLLDNCRFNDASDSFRGYSRVSSLPLTSFTRGSRSTDYWQHLVCESPSTRSDRSAVNHSHSLLFLWIEVFTGSSCLKYRSNDILLKSEGIPRVNTIEPVLDIPVPNNRLVENEPCGSACSNNRLCSSDDFVAGLKEDLRHLRILEDSNVGQNEDPLTFFILHTSINLYRLCLGKIINSFSGFRCVGTFLVHHPLAVCMPSVWLLTFVVYCILYHHTFLLEKYASHFSGSVELMGCVSSTSDDSKRLSSQLLSLLIQSSHKFGFKSMDSESAILQSSLFAVVSEVVKSLITTASSRMTDDVDTKISRTVTTIPPKESRHFRSISDVSTATTTEEWLSSESESTSDSDIRPGDFEDSDFCDSPRAHHVIEPEKGKRSLTVNVEAKPVKRCIGSVVIPSPQNDSWIDALSMWFSVAEDNGDNSSGGEF